MTNVRPRATVVLGGALMIIGSLILWVAVDVGFAEFSRDGIELIEGKITVVAGIVAVLAGLAMTGAGALGWLSSSVAFVASIVGGAALLTEYLDVMRRIRETDPNAAEATVGMGIWVTAAGVLVVLAGAVWSMMAQRAARQEGPTIAATERLDEVPGSPIP